MTITPKSLAQSPSLSKEKRDHDNALVCALEASQLAGKIIDGVLSLHSPPHPFGVVASGLRRVAARLEVIGTDNTPDMREYAKGQLNWTAEQEKALRALFEGLSVARINVLDDENSNFISFVSTVKNLFFPSEKPKTLG